MGQTPLPHPGIPHDPRASFAWVPLCVVPVSVVGLEGSAPETRMVKIITTADDGALLGTSSGGPTYTGVVPTTRRIRGLRLDQAQTIVQITPAWTRGGTSDSVGQSKTSLISARNLLRDLAARGHRIRQIRRVK